LPRSPHVSPRFPDSSRLVLSWFASFGLSVSRRKSVNYLNASPGNVGFAEAVPTIRDGERSVRRDRSANPVAFAFGRFLEVRDHVFRGIRSLVLLEQREVALPDTFDPWCLRDSLIVLCQRLG